MFGDFNKNDVAYLSIMDKNEIIVYYYAGDCDTFAYDEFATFGFSKIDVEERTEHLEKDELDFILKKLNLI